MNIKKGQKKLQCIQINWMVDFFYTALALAGEVGELLNKIKKIARDNIQIEREEIISELGDILWYLS